MTQTECKFCKRPQTRERPQARGTVCNDCRKTQYKLRNAKRIPTDLRVIEHHTAPKVHVVQCGSCGVTLERKSYWRNPSCKSCSRKRSRATDLARKNGRSDEARRYRILMHILGWGEDQFADMVEEIRKCPMAFRARPEGHPARRDWRNEGMPLPRGRLAL